MTQSSQLVSISKSIGTFLEKSRINELNLRNHKRLLRENLGSVAKAYNQWMDYLRVKSRKTLVGRKPETMTENLVDWDDVITKGEEYFRPVLHDILVIAGKAAVERKILKQDRFDPLGVEAIEWVKEHSAEMVVEVTQNTVAGIREYIRWGINEGKSIYHIGREIRPITRPYGQTFTGCREAPHRA